MRIELCSVGTAAQVDMSHSLVWEAAREAEELGVPEVVEICVEFLCQRGQLAEALRSQGFRQAIQDGEEGCLKVVCAAVERMDLQSNDASKTSDTRRR